MDADLMVSTWSAFSPSSRWVNLALCSSPHRETLCFSSRSAPGSLQCTTRPLSPPVAAPYLHGTIQVGLMTIWPLSLLLTNSPAGRRAEVVGSESGSKMVYLQLNHATPPNWQYLLPLWPQKELFSLTATKAEL